MLKKSIVAKEAWLAAIERSNKCKQQLSILGCQVGVMQRGGEEPTIKPFLICYNANNDFETKGQTITISICSFYSQGFYLAWDYKVLFCNCAYHFWCAMAYFNFSYKRIEKSCNQEPHLDWWILSGIRKPTIGDGIKNGGIHMGRR